MTGACARRGRTAARAVRHVLGVALASLATAAVAEAAAAPLRSPVERRVVAAVDRGAPAAL